MASLRRRAIALLFMSATLPAQTRWQQAATTAAFPERSMHAVAYDTARARLVLFGGVTGQTERNDTWEWDGTAWTERASATVPSPRGEHAMAYDVARRRCVLFGGRQGSTFFGDTWEWDGTTWQQIVVSGPPARDGHALAFDATRGRTVLFGGSRTAFGPLPLPFPLDSVGMPGCLLHVSADVLLPLVANGGTATGPFTLCACPDLVGIEFFQQSFSPDPAVNPLGVATSNALAGRVGAR